MRRLILCSTDLRHSPVGRHDDQGGQFRFQRSIEKRKALDIEHVNLVNEQDTGYDFGLAFFPPIRYLAVDLFTKFGLDLSRITGEQGKEALTLAINDINLVERDRVLNFFTSLEFAVGTLHKLGLRIGKRGF